MAWNNNLTGRVPQLNGEHRRIGRLLYAKADDLSVKKTRQAAECSRSHVIIGYVQNRSEISQEAAYALLSALKAVIKGTVFISGFTITSARSGRVNQNHLRRHLALHLASQQRWLGKFAIPEALSVFYIDCEMNPHVLRSRLVRLAKGE